MAEDGGSSINILYRDTMEKLNLKAKQLMPSRTVFHGIVPGLSCSPIGKIKMDVLFGDKDHFRREAIWFEVVDLESPYHALLGRPALCKFMAVPHYAYLKMKMPSSKSRRSSLCQAEPCSMVSSPACLAPQSARSRWMFSSETRIIFAEKRSGSKYWIWRAPTMLCLADLLWPSSWMCPITPT